MALSSDIYSQVGRGVKSVADYDAEAQAAKANKLALLMQQGQYGQFQQGITDQNALRGVVQGFGADTTANYNKLLQAGNLGAAKDYQKSVLDAAEAKGKAAKTTAETTEIGVKTREKAFDYYKNVLGTIQDPQAARNFVMHSYTDPTIGPILQAHGTLEEGLARIPTDPAGFVQWKANAAIGIQKMAELAKVNHVNLGGTMTTQMVQPATGQTTTLASAPITQSADNAASNERAAQIAAAQLAEQRRAHNMADARTREGQGGIEYKQDVEGNWIALPKKPGDGPITAKPVMGPDGKPLAAGSSKPLTEGQGTATTFAARMTDAERVIKRLEKAGTSGSDLSTLAASNNYTNWLASSEGQQYRQAQENWVTANLRKESGAAIPVPEMEKDIRKYFPSIGDGAEVKKQKARAREVATRGMMVQAGPGAKQVPGIVGPDASRDVGSLPPGLADGNDPLGIRKK